jgi:hypothetical protein
MDKIELVQKIGDEICEGCGPHADCGEVPNECSRISSALSILEEYTKSAGVAMRVATIKGLKSLNLRLNCRGFSWQHDDFFLLQEALPLIVGGFGVLSGRVVEMDAEKCVHPTGYIKSARVCGLCGEQV